MNDNTTPKYTLEELETLVEKRCTKCKEYKTLIEFTRDRKNCRDDRRASCGVCEAKRHKANRSKKSPDVLKNEKLLRTYNMTLERYNKILEDQNYCCAICKRHKDEFDRELFVDHDHNCCPGNYGTCGKCVRGLLCDGCNRGVGCFRDNPDVVLDAATYLYHFTNRV